MATVSSLFNMTHAECGVEKCGVDVARGERMTIRAFKCVMVKAHTRLWDGVCRDDFTRCVITYVLSSTFLIISNNLRPCPVVDSAVSPKGLLVFSLLTVSLVLLTNTRSQRLLRMPKYKAIFGCAAHRERYKSPIYIFQNLGE